MIKTGNPEDAGKAADTFVYERTKEMVMNPKAKKWEESRKKTLAKDKPEVVKKRIKAEKIEQDELLRGAKDGGAINYSLTPSRGYVLVDILNKPETTTTGLIISNEEESKQNIAEVLVMGETMKDQLSPIAQVGDTVLLKKHAGMDIVVKSKPLKLCVFSDILAILEE